MCGSPFFLMQVRFPGVRDSFGISPHLGDRRLKLSLGARTYKCRVSYFGTNAPFFVEHIFEKLFHWRDKDHKVVLSSLNVCECNCASKIGAITVHLSPNGALFSNRNRFPNRRFLDPPKAYTSRENRKSRSIFRDIDKLLHPLNFKQLESMSLKYSGA